KDLPPRDLKEFIAYAKGNAEKLNVGHGGVGGLLFTYVLLLNSVLGVKPTMVPFTGGAPAANALVGGQIDYMVNGINEVGQQVQAGTIKAYAIAAWLPAQDKELIMGCALCAWLAWKLQG